MGNVMPKTLGMGIIILGITENIDILQDTSADVANGKGWECRN
jgi:hypothetical protein